MPEPEEPFEYKFKVAVVGDSKVGKHTLLEKASTEVLDSRMVEGMGVKIGVYNVQAMGPGEKEIYATIMLWGITATLREGSFRDRVEGGVQGIIVMADASRPDTVKNARTWIVRMEQKHDLDNMDMVLVLNKVDLVKTNELLRAGTWMRRYAAEYKVPLVLTSCETGLNLLKPFREIAKRMMRRQMAREPEKVHPSDAHTGRLRPKKKE